MSLPGFKPFPSNVSMNSRRNSTQSTRPPTYTSSATASPTYTSHDPNLASLHDHDARVSMWSASLPSASSIVSPDSDTQFDAANSSPTDTVSIMGESAEIARPAGAHYIYYRVYMEDGAIPTKHPISSDNLYLGCIVAELVAPPHTVASLMRYISKIEGIDHSPKSKLFINISSESPIGDGIISIVTSGCPGSMPEDPIAFLCSKSMFTTKLRVTFTRSPSSENAGWLDIIEGEILHTTKHSPRSRRFIAYGRAPVIVSTNEAVNEAGEVGFVNVNHVTPC